MAKLECALAEAEIKPRATPPLLSVVILSYRRVGELKLAVDSFLSQLSAGLEDKVEIVITDNASGGETLDLLRSLAREHAAVSYLVHARNEGGFFNLFAAPWRAQGRYTWVFGSDDALLDGGVAAVTTALERDAPAFMTLNKRTAHADLSGLVWEHANTIPDARFDGFADLFAAVGLNQLAFLSCQIEETARARALDADRYLRTDTRHPHIPAFLEKHHDGLCLYNSTNHVVHRLNNSMVPDYHAGNFFDYAATLPSLLWDVMQKVGAPKDLFERVTGQKRITSYDPPDVTLVDTVFENILRAARYGMFLRDAHRFTLEQILSHCRPQRREQFQQIWDLVVGLTAQEGQVKSARAALDHQLEQALQASAAFAGGS